MLHTAAACAPSSAWLQSRCSLPRPLSAPLQSPPENVLPHKKLNAQARTVLEANRSLQGGALGETIADIQQRLLHGYLRMRARRDGL